MPLAFEEEPSQQQLDEALSLYQQVGGLSYARKQYNKNRAQWYITIEGEDGPELKAVDRKNVQYIARSDFFDADWYLRKYPEVLLLRMNPALHYYEYGWQKGYDPSPRFSTAEYLSLHEGVRHQNTCPLYHYERYGKYEGRKYRKDQQTVPLVPYPLQTRVLRKLRQVREALRYRRVPVNAKKILFQTFQQEYTCNPKYICEELLRRGEGYDIVWLYTDKSERAWFPQDVRLVKKGTHQALLETISAKVLIDNGVTCFSNPFLKKKGQIGICTWHGSLGFKKIRMDTSTWTGRQTRTLYDKVHDYVLSNSSFEDDVYRNIWQSAQILPLGHARNDILFGSDPQHLRFVKEKVRHILGISGDYKLALYAPTFRGNGDNKINAVHAKEEVDTTCFELDYQAVRAALADKFGGEWVVLSRQHFVNREIEDINDGLPEGVVSATAYPDIQELMLVSDVGITDYSSWILDFMFTRKPGFVYATDEDLYLQERGFYYPLREAPFPVATDTSSLLQNIRDFDQAAYEQAIDRFLIAKGSIEDGQANRRIVEKIVEWTR